MDAETSVAATAVGVRADPSGAVSPGHGNSLPVDGAEAGGGKKQSVQAKKGLAVLPLSSGGEPPKAEVYISGVTTADGSPSPTPHPEGANFSDPPGEDAGAHVADGVSGNGTASGGGGGSGGGVGDGIDAGGGSGGGGDPPLPPPPVTLPLPPPAPPLSSASSPLPGEDHPPLSFGIPSAAAVLPPPADQLHRFQVCPPTNHYTPPVAPGQLEALSNEELSSSDLVFSKEFAELSFNSRVLALALDDKLPLLERFKFCCIVSANLDEHFAKRLGNIPRDDSDDEDGDGSTPAPAVSSAASSGSANSLSKATAALRLRRQIRPRSQFEADLADAVRSIVNVQHEVLTETLLPALRGHGIELIPYEALTPAQGASMTAYFRRSLFPLLTPMSVDQTHPFPLLQSHGIYLLVVLLNPESGVTRRVYFRVPAVKPRLLPVTPLQFLPVEQLVVAHLPLVCEGMTILRWYAFRVTRNTKLVVDDTLFGESDNLLDYVWEEVHRRRSAPATRLEVTSTMPMADVARLAAELALDATDVYTLPGPLLGLADCMSIAFAPVPHLQHPPHEPVTPPRFRGLEDKLQSDPGRIFSVIRKGDVLVQYPAHSFTGSALLFLRAAARDPRVRVIKQVLYRGGSHSPLVASLIRAAKSGKEVTVLVELKASFDEVQNSEYARRLQRAGCNVSYGLVGLKTHCKTMVVVREEEAGGLRAYVNVATGNFNPTTAKLYTDMALFTCAPAIAADVLDLFNALTGYSRKRNYRRLLVAPVSMLDRVVAMIAAEAAHARAGRPARIIAQINGLTEPEIIRHLYAASQAGVIIDLIIRGPCRLRPGLPGRSENIRVFSWVGRFLQHRRVFYFSAGGSDLYFISSADWRSRNLNDRIEVATPVDDPRIKRKLRKSLNFFLNDRLHTWQLASDGRYYMPRAPLTTVGPPAVDEASSATAATLAGFARPPLRFEQAPPSLGGGSSYAPPADAFAEFDEGEEDDDDDYDELAAVEGGIWRVPAAVPGRAAVADYVRNNSAPERDAFAISGGDTSS